MILSALVDLAQREGLVEEPDFEKKYVAAAISIDSAGKFLGWVSLQEKDQRGKLIGQKLDVPRGPKRSNGINAGFLADNIKYVLGIGDDPERDDACRQAFVDLIKHAATGVRDDGLNAILNFYEQFTVNLAEVLKQQPQDQLPASEFVVFALDTDLGGFVHERPLVRQCWKAMRQESAGQNVIRCLGKMSSVVWLRVI